MSGFQLVCKILEQPAGALRIASGIPLVHRGPNRSSHPFGQRVGDVAFLVCLAALDQRTLAEGVEDHPAQGLGSVDHHQDRAIRMEPSFDQIFQQRLARSCVFGRAFPQAQGVFFAAAIDAHRGQHHVLGEVHPVDQQRDQLEPTQLASHQFGQPALRTDHEPFANGALAMQRTSTACGNGSSERA